MNLFSPNLHVGNLSVFAGELQRPRWRIIEAETIKILTFSGVQVKNRKCTRGPIFYINDGKLRSVSSSKSSKNYRTSLGFSIQ